MRRKCRERFPRHRGLAIPTCITARARRTCRDACRDRKLSVSFEVDGGENVPGIPGACATHNFTYLLRGSCVSPSARKVVPEVHTNVAGQSKPTFCASILGYTEYYDMAVWVLAGNDCNVSNAAGLIRLYIPGSNNLVCNEGERVSPYSPSQSLTPFMGNSSTHWCQKHNCNLQICLQIHCKYVRLWWNFIIGFKLADIKGVK